MNAVFRVYKYLPNYAAFDGKVLTPGDFVEKYSTSVADGFEQRPASFELLQNYPNPFNPATVIRYQIPADCIVTLKIYDVLGNDVKTLVNQYQSQGRYAINFDASSLVSGIYFYRISAAQYSSVKKMMFVK
jgi:hypothetical protein